MESWEKQHPDNADRVLLRPAACSTTIVKKSSVGHVPHEPSKGAVVRDVSSSAVPISGSSTAAHGGLKVSVGTSEIKQKYSGLPRHDEIDAISPAVQHNITQSSLISQGHFSAITTDSNCRVATSPVDCFKTSFAHVSLSQDSNTAGTSPCLSEASSPVTLSDLAEDCRQVGLFPETFLNPADTVNTQNSVPSCTSENSQTLETEVVSLKEQLVVQSKVCL